MIPQLSKEPAMNQHHVFRVDRFHVPSAAREEFLERVTATHRLLANQRGFVRDFLLEQPAGENAFSLVTMAEWESQEAVERAKEAVGAMHRQAGFDPREMFGRLGIRAEMGSYRPLGEVNGGAMLG
jgi:heme-degrading monooxygenase HmoA